MGELPALRAELALHSPRPLGRLTSAGRPAVKGVEAAVQARRVCNDILTTRYRRQDALRGECMAIRDICKYPDPVLRKKAAPVKVFDEQLRALANDMVETMYAEPGVGLAAPQVGVSRRLLVIDISVGAKPDTLIVLVNPKIVSAQGRLVEEEGCLSVPGIRAEIPRAEFVEIRGWNLDQEEVSLKGHGYLARAFQHEMDHLDGMLIWERMGKVQREILKTEWKRLQRDAHRG
jgi:peptide deformylase